MLYDFNMTRPTELKKCEEMLKDMFAEIGEGCYIEPPFYANFGGAHIHFGKNIYCNFGVTMVDDTHIYVGDYTMFGPKVTVATAGHPVLPDSENSLTNIKRRYISEKTAGLVPMPLFYPELP